MTPQELRQLRSNYRDILQKIRALKEQEQVCYRKFGKYRDGCKHFVSKWMNEYCNILKEKRPGPYTIHDCNLGGCPKIKE